MALELIDGFAGKAHIGSDDLAALNSGCFGTGDYVFNYGQNLKATMTNANTCTIGTGALVSKGRRSVNLASTALTVQSGAQGQKRNDLVVARYAKTSGKNVESCTLTVIKGTPVSYGTAADPSVTANDMKLWRIPIDGITPGTPVQLFETIPSIDELRDSVSQGESASFLNNDLRFTRVGRTVYVSVDGEIDMGDNAWSTVIIGTLPNGLRPEMEVYFGLTVQASTAPVVLTVQADGKVATRALGGAVPGRGWAFGSGSYIVA